jgi:hypothetical protein
MRVRNQRQNFVFGPEPLESREMLSASGISSISHLAAHSAAIATSQGHVENVSSTVAGASSSHVECHAQTSLSATLADPANSSATGTVTYSLTKTSSKGTNATNFKVSVSGATANSTLDVAINGIVVGQIATDGTGAGSLILSSTPTGTQQQLPTNFPATVSADSIVTVGTLSGTLGSMHVSHKMTLIAQLTDSTGSGTGTATFKSNTESGKTRLSLSVTGLAANSTLDVMIGGTVVGQITTNSSGTGMVKFKNPTTVVTSGSTITVGTLSGTFATGSSGENSEASEAHSFSRRR